MEKDLKFSSAVCTSRVQSERLLALGLKKETADMCWTKDFDESYYLAIETYYFDDDIPAWSLHSLIEMLKNSRITISFIEKDTAIIVERYGVFQNVCEIWDNTYENICDAIEWLIKERYFNKEYLV